jgi:hypothetical protein
MPAFWITYCTDVLLEELGDALRAIMGDFKAYTLFEKAGTLVTYEGSCFCEEEVLRRCKDALASRGAMEFFHATCKEIHGQRT